MKAAIRTVLCSLLAAAGLHAEVSAPSPGIVRFAGWPLEALLGVPGNLVPAPSSLGDADAVSFSDTAGLLVRGDVIRLVRPDGSPVAEYMYAGAPPVLGADPSLHSALAWLPEANSLVWWNGKRFQTVAIDAFQGLVSSLQMDGTQTARFLINHPDGGVSSARVSLPRGDLISMDYVPGVKAPAFEFGAYRISANEHGLVLEWSGDAQQALPFPATRFTAEQMSSAWVHLYIPATRQHFGLHLNRESSTLSRLPAPVASEGGQR
jgi:hypothetical protein